jgi:hypothetical protein
MEAGNASTVLAQASLLRGAAQELSSASRQALEALQEDSSTTLTISLKR